MGQHMENRRAVFQILSDNGLAMNLEKCEFAVPELDLLGQRLSAAGNQSGSTLHKILKVQIPLRETLLLKKSRAKAYTDRRHF
jgi:hypothetical protein